MSRSPGKRLDRLDYRTWILCGDSEMAEGSIWEALAQASYENLDNLTAIIDVNRLGQTGPTRYEWDLDVYADRLRAFGWHAIEIDGHDVEAIDRAYAEAIATKEQAHRDHRAHAQGQGRLVGREQERLSTASPSMTPRTRFASWAAGATSASRHRRPMKMPGLTCSRPAS